MKNRYTGCQSAIYPSLLLCFYLTNAGFRYTIYFLTEVGQTAVLKFVTILNLRLSGIVILLPFTDLQDRRRSHRTLLFFGPHTRQAQSPSDFALSRCDSVWYSPRSLQLLYRQDKTTIS